MLILEIKNKVLQHLLQFSFFLNLESQTGEHYLDWVIYTYIYIKKAMISALFIQKIINK